MNWDAVGDNPPPPEASSKTPKKRRALTAEQLARKRIRDRLSRERRNQSKIAAAAAVSGDKQAVGDAPQRPKLPKPPLSEAELELKRARQRERAAVKREAKRRQAIVDDVMYIGDLYALYYVAQSELCECYMANIRLFEANVEHIAGIIEVKSEGRLEDEEARAAALRIIKDTAANINIAIPDGKQLMEHARTRMDRLVKEAKDTADAGSQSWSEQYKRDYDFTAKDLRQAIAIFHGQASEVDGVVNNKPWNRGSGECTPISQAIPNALEHMTNEIRYRRCLAIVFYATMGMVRVFNGAAVDLLDKIRTTLVETGGSLDRNHFGVIYSSASALRLKMLGSFDRDLTRADSEDEDSDYNEEDEKLFKKFREEREQYEEAREARDRITAMEMSKNYKPKDFVVETVSD